MRIGIDARMYGLEHAGIGRYIKNLVDRIISIDSVHTYTLFLNEPYYSKLVVPNNTKKVFVNIRHYTLREQIQMPRFFNQANLDLLHVPHFNVPLLYRRPFVVTIHDILWHQFKGSAVTTLSPLLYYGKYQGYKAVVSRAVSAAKAIIVPSLYVKKQLISEFPRLNKDKVFVTYEGVDPSLMPSNPKRVACSAQPYLIYVGSCYPHKNVNLIIEALSDYNREHPPLQLKIVSARDVFVDKLTNFVKERHLEAAVEFVGRISDDLLSSMVAESVALIQPSLSEGFGLTGIEAMGWGAPVIAANTTALPEIYGQAALYFDPKNSKDLVEKITLIQQPGMRQKYITSGFAQAVKYSWDTMVTATLEIYAKAI